ncbi:MAG: hypothetical protein K2Y02_10145 [Burkholderiaceae bacterium]|nr:hypothetical protein [Burkholderiaceae bacterium]
MQSASMSLAVVIHGPKGAHEAREYISPVDHATYVEGREGSNFTLRITNGTARRVLAVPALDGLSVLDGKPAGASSLGYVLAPHQTIDLGGWIVDGETAAKFFFAGCSSDANDSYVAQMGGDTANNGVIGVIFFAEDRPASVFRNHGGAMLSASSSASKGVLRSEPLAASAAMPEAAMQSLGAGFGEAMEFRTRSVDFRRGARLVDLVIHYDDARGLKRRGIDVSRPTSPRPNAFPADGRGCATPPGWQG